MGISRILAVVSVILFGVAFVLVIGDSSNAKTVEELLYLGLALFAGSHCID